MAVEGIGANGDMIDQMVELSKFKEQEEAAIKYQKTQQKVDDALQKMIENQRSNDTYA